jgi:hypothetical protein
MAGKTKSRADVLREDGPTKRAFARTANRARLQKEGEAAIAATGVKYDGVYTEELAALLFDMVVKGTTLAQIGTLPGMPGFGVMLRWAGNPDHPFHRLYYEAKRLRVPYLEEQAAEIAANPQLATRRRIYQVVDKHGEVHTLEETVEGDNVERAKLQVGVLQWQLAWNAPVRHGPKAEPVKDKGSEQLEALFAALKQGPAESA